MVSRLESQAPIRSTRLRQPQTRLPGLERRHHSANIPRQRNISFFDAPRSSHRNHHISRRHLLPTPPRIRRRRPLFLRAISQPRPLNPILLSTPPSNHPLALLVLPLHTRTPTPPRSLLAESNRRPHRDRAASARILRCQLRALASSAGQDLHGRRLDAADPEARGANHVWPGARVFSRLVPGCAAERRVCVTAWGYVGLCR
jgi:hypothetical protein